MTKDPSGADTALATVLPASSRTVIGSPDTGSDPPRACCRSAAVRARPSHNLSVHRTDIGGSCTHHGCLDALRTGVTAADWCPHAVAAAMLAAMRIAFIRMETSRMIVTFLDGPDCVPNARAFGRPPDQPVNGRGLRVRNSGFISITAVPRSRELSRVSFRAQIPSRIFTTPLAVVIGAPTEFERLTARTSFPSVSVSPCTCTAMV